MPSHIPRTPEDIINTVNDMETDRHELHDRMDDDLDMYNLVEYAGEIDENGVDALAGFQHFTANDPATVINLAMHFGISSKLTIRVNQTGAQRDQRDINNAKELFGIGILNMIDERRANLLQPSLKESLFSQSLLRGRISVRSLLIKEDLAPEDVEEGPSAQLNDILEELGLEVEPTTTRTFADVTDWDPRNTYWQIGKHGVAWSCNVSKKTREDIIAEWDHDPATDAESDGHDEFKVYDFFDDKDNLVLLEDKTVLKKRTAHGMKRTPIPLAMAGGISRFQTEDEDYSEHHGESFYRASRRMFQEQNFMLSIEAEIAKRSILGPQILESLDGSFTLDEDARLSGMDTQTSTTNQEKILPLEQIKLSPEAFALLGTVTNKMQLGTFPSTAFGTVEFPLSGFALTQLRGGIEAPLTPHINAVKSAYRQILTTLADAYASGAFDTMELSGRLDDPQRSWFSEEITPEAVAQGGAYEIDLVPVLPQDDAAKAALAQQLRVPGTTGKPLADDRYIRENTLMMQNADQVARAVDEQAGLSGTPVAVAYNNYLAFFEQGDQDNANIWWDEYNRQRIQAFLELLQLTQVSGGQTSPNDPGQGRGQVPPAAPTLPSPQNLPPEAQGIFSAPNTPGTPGPQQPIPSSSASSGF